MDRNRLYGFVRGILRLFGLAYFRMESVGDENLAASGPMLLVCNHASNLDPPFVGTTARRHMHFLAKAGAVQYSPLRPVHRPDQRAPINRGGVDRRALRECQEILSGGGVLVIFPEGTRTRDGNCRRRSRGGAMIAAQAQVPIVPVYIEGSFEALPRGRWFPRPKKVRVHYGKPFNAAERNEGCGQA